MKFIYILIFALSIVATSCGKSKKEIEQEKAKIELENKLALEQEIKERLELEEKLTAEKRENERIHLEKIEFGKSVLRTKLNSELEKQKDALFQEKNRLQLINEFQLGRLSSTKQKQINEQRLKIEGISSLILKLENEISKTNIRETYEFQNSPASLINQLFLIARTQDFKKLRNLYDPYGESSEAVMVLCLLKLQPEQFQNEYFESLMNGRIIGKPNTGLTISEIEIANGINSDRLTKVKLIKRLDNWYLLSI